MDEQAASTDLLAEQIDFYEADAEAYQRWLESLLASENETRMPWPSDAPWTQ